MQEQWQLYDEQGRAIKDQGAIKDDVFRNGLLHGASHVWIWRKNGNNVEILLQKRANHKRTWPNLYDISAAGHIDLGEDPLTAALRESNEEIGIDITAEDLQLIGIQYAYMVDTKNNIEHEFQWLFLLEITNETDFVLQDSEVDSVKWIKLETFESDVNNELEKDSYVPHGVIYYNTLISSLRLVLANG